MNIKDLRQDLKQWGRFWSDKESLQGYASKSSIHRCGEVLRTGLWISSDKHLFSHQADSIYVPFYIKAIDSAVITLPEVQRAVVTRRYIKEVFLTPTEKLALLHAESALLAELY